MPTANQTSKIRTLALHAGYTWRHPSGSLMGDADSAAAALIGEDHRRTWHTSQEVCDMLQTKLVELAGPEKSRGLAPKTNEQKQWEQIRDSIDD